METKIDLQGIIRNTRNLNSPPGSMNEIINIRKKYGSWRPILPKTRIKTNYAPSVELFIHTMDEAEYFISYDTDGTLKALDNQGVPYETIATYDPGLTISINSLGYFLIVDDLTNYVKYIYRCAPTETPKYSDLSDIPDIDMTISTYNEGLPSWSQTTDWTQDGFAAGWVLLEKQAKTDIPEYFEGWVFLRWAIELIDGTFLKHSLPFFAYNGHVTCANLGPGVNLQITSQLCRLYYFLPASLPAHWADYEKLIRGVTIFMTKPISKYDWEQSGVDGEGIYIGLTEKPNLLIDEFRNASAYYYIHHIPFNKVVATGTGVIGAGKPISFGFSNVTIDLSNISVVNAFKPANTGHTTPIAPQYNPSNFNINDITSYEILNVDDVSHHKLMGIRNLNYNSRLFMGDIYTRLFDGYNIADLIKSAGSAATEFDIYIEVDLTTDLGTRTVRQTMKWAHDAIKIPIIIGYPDVRATELRIIHNSGGAGYKKLVIALEGHPVLNMATANKVDGVDITAQAKSTDGFQTILISAIATSASLATLNTSLRDKNRVQLTELYNPFITPAINSYQVGEGNIVAMGVNVVPLEDRFGTFPVFVFSSRGIWTLNLSDTGDVVVSNIVPLSSAVCTNPDSVIVVGNLLVFLASDGVKLLTGQDPSEISDLAEGPYASVLAGNDAYTQIKAQSQLNLVSANLSVTDLLSYCKPTDMINYTGGAIFGYDKYNREIIVSNYSYNYSYIYSLIEKIWYKSSYVYKQFINAYPNMYGLATGNDLVIISEETPYTPDATSVYFETKPIAVGPDKEVKLTKTILGGNFSMTDNFYGGLYIFGSNDSSYWALITGKEITGDSIYNITIPRLPISIRYAIFIFSGTLKQESSISELRITT